ncbi:deoxyribodipyrimidine photo-lyase [Desulfomicrobium apsheronum]|nr:deoxyribodipyrimidine photo-lyase [Desulfomicrobium apsheronum]
MNPRRVHILKDAPIARGPVLYWMHRDFRARDNWGLTYARLQALRAGQPVAVVFCLAPEFVDATVVHFNFLLDGLAQTVQDLRQQNIGFFALTGSPGLEVARFARGHGAGLVVTDFDPLRVKRRWHEDLLSAVDQPVHEVDSRNIVPARVVSDRREFMARTIRPKIKRLLLEFLDEFPALPAHPHDWPTTQPEPDFSVLRSKIQNDAARQNLLVEPGEQAGQAVLHDFLKNRLPFYAKRNDPNQDVCSNLSAHLHFGMLSAQRAALETQARGLAGEHVDSFLDELIVRRELSDNFCLHTPNYDTEDGFPAWARESLHKHRNDPRPVIHSPEELEKAGTHDPLWNAAQTQMLHSGKMHGYLRMYWAKKILEWSPSPAEALRTAILLNDRYSLDGRNSNGYTGIAWSIGGVHDRGWTERPIFGKIRFMNYAGARRKFDVDQYVRKWTAPEDDASI